MELKTGSACESKNWRPPFFALIFHREKYYGKWHQQLTHKKKWSRRRKNIKIFFTLYRDLSKFFSFIFGQKVSLPRINHSISGKNGPKYFNRFFFIIWRKIRSIKNKLLKFLSFDVVACAKNRSSTQNRRCNNDFHKSCKHIFFGQFDARERERRIIIFLEAIRLRWW